MSYRSINYATNPKAPADTWVCSPGSALGPFDEAPAGGITKDPNYCGQCVSYVKQVTPGLPQTLIWTQGEQVKATTAPILAGTVIATFNNAGKYFGHAAIYVSHDAKGISVYDQYMTTPGPKGVGPRLLRWGASGIANNGDNFYVVE
jgi:hypothetical protein